MAKGGARPNSGRKPKVEEEKLIQHLDSIIDPTNAIKKLGELINSGSEQAIKIYLQYRFGIPKQLIEHSGTMTHSVNFELFE